MINMITIVITMIFTMIPMIILIDKLDFADGLASIEKDNEQK